VLLLSEYFRSRTGVVFLQCKHAVLRACRVYTNRPTFYLLADIAFSSNKCGTKIRNEHGATVINRFTRVGRDFARDMA